MSCCDEEESWVDAGCCCDRVEMDCDEEDGRRLGVVLRGGSEGKGLIGCVETGGS